MFQRLKRLTVGKSGSTDRIQTQNKIFLPPLLPPPPSLTLDESPEIRVLTEEPLDIHNPVAPDPCRTCGPLTACTEQLVPKEDLIRSADKGCSICCLLWKACTQTDDIDHADYVSTWSSSGGVFGIYLSRKIPEDGGEATGQAVSVIVLASDGERAPSPFPWLSSIVKSPFNRSQFRDIQMLSSWINDCQQNHPSCQQIVLPKLPTRVIDVGSDMVQPFLKITQGELGRYLALSHRWGNFDAQHKILTTKREYVEQFCQSIPLESFPLTFKHSVEVCRSVGIQYLWIDSLCIVQDDQQDWEIEATRMGDIYENAYATLFAEGAKNCEDGLFQTAENKNIVTDWIREIEYRNPKTNEQHWILASCRHSYYPNSLDDAFCLVDKPISHLENRGWIMQEEILSRRKICFSETELHWQCNSMSQCECGLKSLADMQFRTDPTRNLLLTHRFDGSVTRGLSATTSNDRRRKTDGNKSWKKLVEIYSQRAFTNERDRLSALAGVASKLGRPSQNYLAGIWREDVSDQLLWRGLNQKEAPCSRYKSYYAPTWSWASILGGIVFCSLNEGRQQIWKIVEGTCQPTGENPMGPVSMGVLRIQSKIASVVVEECEGPALDVDRRDGLFENHGIYEQKRNGKTYHLVLRSSIRAGKKPGVVSQDTIISLDSEDDWEIFAGKKSQQYHYLIAQAGGIPGRGFSMSKEVYWTMGLLIRESAIEKGYWERICLVRPQGWWRDWRHFAEDREVLLR